MRNRTSTYSVVLPRQHDLRVLGNGMTVPAYSLVKLFGLGLKDLGSYVLYCSVPAEAEVTGCA